MKTFTCIQRLRNFMSHTLKDLLKNPEGRKNKNKKKLKIKK